MRSGDNSPGPEVCAARCVGLVVLVALLARVLAFVVYRPFHATDSTSYMDLAGQVLLWNFDGYDATRTLGYPIFLALLGVNSTAVAILQMALGVAMSAIVAALVIDVTRRPGLAMAAGLLAGLSPNMILLEMTIMTEAISASLLAVGVFLLVRGETTGRIAWHVMAGLVFGAVLAIRPVYFFLPVLVPLILGLAQWRAESPRRPFLPRALASGGPGLVILVLLLLFNRHHMGHAMLSTNAYLGLANHSIDFAELSDDEVVGRTIATNRDLYLSMLLASRDNRASLGMWTYPELKQALGVDQVGLALRLRDFSIDLYAAHPFLYARSVMRSWVDFWRVPLIYGSSALRRPDVGRALLGPWPLFKLAWVAAGGLFLLGLLAPSKVLGNVTSAACYGIVFATSVVQVFFESGENARYGIPTLPLVAIGCALTLDALLKRWRPRD